MTQLSPADIIDLYDEGVAAIADAAAEREGRAWHKTVVGEWSAHELARHLLAVCEWYHQWLDRAEAGDSSPPFPAKQLAGRNELEVLDLDDLDGPDAIAKFLERAAAYRRRLDDLAEAGQWDLPYGFAHGVTTVGGHAGIAAGEWHLHAWDLRSGDHVPAAPGQLYRAVGDGMTRTQPTWKRMITRRVVGRIAERDPWTDLLKRSGRQPRSPEG